MVRDFRENDRGDLLYRGCHGTCRPRHARRAHARVDQRIFEQLGSFWLGYMEALLRDTNCRASIDEQALVCFPGSRVISKNMTLRVSVPMSWSECGWNSPGFSGLEQSLPISATVSRKSEAVDPMNGTAISGCRHDILGHNLKAIGFLRVLAICAEPEHRDLSPWRPTGRKDIDNTSICVGSWRVKLKMSDHAPEIDWNLTTWEGSRREQLRRWRKLSLRDRLRAVEEMADTSRRLHAMRRQGQHPEPTDSGH